MLTKRASSLAIVCAALLIGPGCGGDSGTTGSTAAAPVHTPVKSSAPPKAQRRCREFKSHAAAQAFYENHKSEAERSGFDLDHDGLACEGMVKK